MNQSSFSISYIKGVQLLVINDLMDQQNNDTLFDQVFQEKSHFSPNIVIDLGAVVIMNSLGINLLLKLDSQAKVLGGKAIFANTTSKVNQLIKLTKLDTVFTIAPDINQALEYFQTNS